jgi:hypothetical protein
MSQIFKAILAAFAITAAFGAVQLASGHDLASLRQLASIAPAAEVNRAAKVDRAALRAAQSQTETITIRNVGLDDTSVVVRVPVAQEETRNRPVAPAPVAPAKPGVSNKPGASKNAIACEPPVSVLTEVAKLLQPGRCVT